VESINYCEVMAVIMLLMGNIETKVTEIGAINLFFRTDNTRVVHVTNAMVTASRPMMRELRKLTIVLDSMGVTLSTEWLPTVTNKFVDALSRRFPRDDLRVRCQRRRSVMDGLLAPKDAFPYRPLGEHPVFAQKQAFLELAGPWQKGGTLLLYPPVDLVGAVVRKLRITKAPEVLLVPDWPAQQCNREAIALSRTITR
jgi:hypothetical protein